MGLSCLSDATRASSHRLAADGHHVTVARWPCEIHLAALNRTAMLLMRYRARLVYDSRIRGIAICYARLRGAMPVTIARQIPTSRSIEFQVSGTTPLIAKRP